MFGYSWLDSARSLHYIKNVPLYTLTVLVCSVPATAVFIFLWKRCVQLLRGTGTSGKNAVNQTQADGAGDTQNP